MEMPTKAVDMVMRAAYHLVLEQACLVKHSQCQNLFFTCRLSAYIALKNI